MKKLVFTIFSLLFFALCVQAQTPKAFKYRTFVRNAAGQTLANQQVAFGIDLIQNSTTVYAENHLITTNPLGLINLEYPPVQSHITPREYLICPCYG